MTLYTRGYRRYERGLESKAPRFWPILVQGYRDAVAGKAFRFFRTISVIACVVFCAILYFNPATMMRAVGARGAGRLPDAGEVLRGALTSFTFVAAIWMPLVSIFVGGGLVAEDLRTRALPLYLVRPMTPTDYWLGKLSIPVAAAASVLLFPALTIVAFAAMLQPSTEVLSFLGGQGRVVLAVVVHYLAVAFSYGSVMLVVSTLAGRRVVAMIVGAVVFLGGPFVRGTVGKSRGPLADLLKAVDLPTDTVLVFQRLIGDPLNLEDKVRMPSLGAAVAVLCLVTALGALVVLLRARTVEVVS